MINDAVIKVRLDTGAAEADFRRLESAFARASGAATLGVGGRSGGGAVGGGFAGFSMSGLLPTIGGISLGAAAFGTLASDAWQVGRGSLDWVGRSISSAFGLSNLSSSMKSIDRAAAMTAQAFGPTNPSESSIRGVLQAFRRITDPEEATRRKIEDIAGVDKRDEVLKALDDIGKKLSELPEGIAKALGNWASSAQGWMAENVWGPLLGR